MGPSPAVATVRHAVRRALADLAPGDRVLVACSGGADSLALAAALAFEARGAALLAGAVVVDHGLQDGSAERASTVAALLGELGLDPVEVATVRVGTAGGPEAAARRARYHALDEACERLGAAAVLLGHTLDDQAETVLLGLARGSGARSLAGMAAVNGRYRRPLLELDRSLVRAAAQGLPVWEDPHNRDPTYARARVRHEAIEAIDRALGPGVPAALARTARLLRADADALDGWADRAYDEVRAPAGAAGGPPDGSETGPDGSLDVSLDVSGLAELPAAVRTRVLRRALVEAGSPPGDLGAAHVAHVDSLVTGWRGQGPLHLPGGVRARRECGRLLLSGA